MSESSKEGDRFLIKWGVHSGAVTVQDYSSLTTSGRISEMAGFFMLFTAGSKKDIKVWTCQVPFFLKESLVSFFLFSAPVWDIAPPEIVQSEQNCWSVIFQIKMCDALKLFSLYMSFDMVYIEAVLGFPEKKVFPLVFSHPPFFFSEAKQGHLISPELPLRSNMYLTLIGSERQWQ